MSSRRSKLAVPRYHGLDALRAVMMLLGLVFHTAINYLPIVPPSAKWPYQDTQTNIVFAWMIAVLHMFRMPVFFVVAGFFGAFVYESRGFARFLRHRLARLGLPLVCAWPILRAVTVASVPYWRTFTAAPPPYPEIVAGAELQHLWFLYHLLIFCFVAALAGRAAQRVPAGWRMRCLGAYEDLVRSGWGILLLAAISTPPLLPMETWHFDTASGLLPAPHVLGGYAVFFAFGWLLFHRRDLLDRFEAHPWRFLLAGFLCHIAYLFFFEQGYPDPVNPSKVLLTNAMYAPFHAAGLTHLAATGTHVATMFCLALTIWLLVYGFLGLFLRYLARPNAYWRYLADASYWMYIVHLPLAVWVPVMLTGLPLPAALKFTLALAGVAAITLVTYHYLARSTFVGAMLNGRRYPRSFPWRATGPAS